MRSLTVLHTVFRSMSLQFLPLVIISYGAIATQSVQAQLLPDRSLNTIVTSGNGRDFAITGGARAGDNLFHSFREFSIPTSGSASFDAANARNIFARVTGIGVSHIDGTVRSLSPANLFLLNPNGILFGPNAKLEIGGSFLATTADRIRFADGVVLATTDEQPLLTVSAPIGLQLGAGTIEHRGTLNSTPGKTLGLLGGDITLAGGKLQNFGGNIEVGSVGAGSEVGLLPKPQGWTLDYGDVARFQDITLRNGSAIDATGLGGGNIQVQGRNVRLQTASTIGAGTVGALPGGAIVVNGSESIDLNNTLTPNFLVGGISSFVGPNATGKAADIFVSTPNLSIQGGRVSTGNIGNGPAGNILVQADRVIIKNSTVMDTAVITNRISGLFSTVLGSEARGGNISIKSKYISVQEGNQISTGTFGGGAAGNIDIQSDYLEAIGTSSDYSFQGSGISTEVFNALSRGKGGDIRLNLSQLKLINGGRISASTSGPGNAGIIEIKAQNIEIAGTALFLSPDGTALNSGIFASANPVRFPPGLNLPVIKSNVAVTSGASGSIQLTTDRITLRDQGAISVVNFSNINKLSNIDITASEIILRQGGKITTDARGNVAGGDIRLNTNFLIALENSDITANAISNFGGRVSVRAQSILGTAFRSQLTPDSDITASSDLGAEFSGKVELTTLKVDLNDGLATLPTDTVDSSQQIASRCDSNKGSQFIITGRGGTAINPIAQNPSMRSWQDLRSPSNNIAATTVDPPSPILEASTWQINKQGQPELLGGKVAHDRSAIASCNK